MWSEVHGTQRDEPTPTTGKTNTHQKKTVTVKWDWNHTVNSNVYCRHLPSLKR